MFFSIIIPVYNNLPKLVDRALQSALKQEFDDFEIVLVNDGATDKDITEYMESVSCNAKIRYVRLTENQGISAARQAGIRQAAGEWVCFLDCDDYYKSDYLTDFAKAIRQSTNLDVVMSGFMVEDDSGGILSKYPLDNAKYVNSEYLYYASSAIWNRAYRKSFLIEHDIHFPKNCMTEDMTFLAQVNMYARRMEYTNSYTYVNYYNVISTSRSKKFTGLSIGEMPFDDISMVLDKVIGSEEKLAQSECLLGMLYEQIIILGCLLSRNVRSKKEVQGIIRRSCGLITRIPKLDKHVAKWNRGAATKTSLKWIERAVALSAKIHAEYFVMYAINRLLGRIL